MENMPRTHKDIESLIREIQSKKKEIPVEKVETDDKGVALTETGFYDSEIYDGRPGKSKYEGYVTSIAANDEDDEEDEYVGYSQKRTGAGAPVAFLNDFATSDKSFDPFADKRRPTIADREDEYRQKRRRLVLSPERVDPFADDGKPVGINARGFTQIMKEQMLKGEEAELRKKILEKSKEGSGKTSSSDIKSAPRKRRRWDQTAADVVSSNEKAVSPKSSTWTDKTTTDHRREPATSSRETPKISKRKERKRRDSSSSDEIRYDKKKSYHEDGRRDRKRDVNHKRSSS